MSALKTSHQADLISQLCLLFRAPAPFRGVTLLPPHLYPTFQLSLSPPNTWLLRKGWEVGAISDWGLWGGGGGRGRGRYSGAWP